MLKHYRNIMTNLQGPPSKGLMSSIWGSLASSILNTEFEEAADVIMKLDNHLEDAAKITKAELLTQRAWLLHWSLFPIFQTETMHPSSPVTKLLDNLLQEKSLSIASLACPHLFRYVSAALILHKRLKHLVSSTVWIIDHEALNYSDPITRFMRSLFIDIDSEKGRVVMSKAPPSVYQQVIEKTKNLSFRSTMLLANLEKLANEQAAQAH